MITLRTRLVLWVLAATIAHPQSTSSSQNNPTISKAGSYYYFLMGSLASFDNDSASALAGFQKAAESDPINPTLQLRMVEELLNLNKSSEARAILMPLATSQTKNPEFFLLQARLGSQEADLALSLRSLDQASTLFMDSGNTMKAREMVLTKVAMLADNHEYQQSVAALEKFLKQEPEDEISYYFLGKIHTIFQNRSAAKKAFQKAIELRPTFLAASKALGLQLELEGKLDQAFKVYQKALRGGATDEELIQKLINLSLINDNYVSALEYLHQYLLINPDDAQNLMRAGLIHYKLKHYTEATEIFEACLKNSSIGQDRILFYLGSLNDEQDLHEKSLSYLNRIPETSEYYIEARLQIAQILAVKMHQKDEAIASLRKAVTEKPDSQDLVVALASIHEQSENISEAVRVLENGSEKFQDSEKISFLLGSLLDRMGDFDGSIRVMRHVLSLNINNAHALNHIGYSYADRGINLEEAESLLKRAIQLSPKNGFILDSLGWTYFQMKKYQKAREFLEKADRMSPEQPIILEHLADTYQKIGKRREALEVYKKIMRTSVAQDGAANTTGGEIQTVQGRVKEKMALLDTNNPN